MSTHEPMQMSLTEGERVSSNTSTSGLETNCCHSQLAFTQLEGCSRRRRRRRRVRGKAELRLENRAQSKGFREIASKSFLLVVSEKVTVVLIRRNQIRREELFFPNRARYEGSPGSWQAISTSQVSGRRGKLGELASKVTVR